MGLQRQPKRDYVFIDESGDPGHRSTHFSCIALHTTDVGLRAVVECFADLRFYRQVFSEMKRLHEIPALRPKLVEVLRGLQDAGHVTYTITFLDKSRYTGRYLDPGHGTEFRNFQARRLLEAHFSHAVSATPDRELVFDRHSHSTLQLAEFARYLNNNKNLPSFSAVTAVDSGYVEAVQVADLALRLFGRKYLVRDPDYSDVKLGFIRSWDITAMSRSWTP